MQALICALLIIVGLVLAAVSLDELVDASWLGWLNYLVLQWFFVRLARVIDSGRTVGWKWLVGVVPLTGWWSDFRFVRFHRRDAFLFLLLVPATLSAQRTVKLSPGSVASTDKKTICVPGYASHVRSVPQSRKDLVFFLYGIPDSLRHLYVIDHVVPLAIGGSNLLSNLAPQLIVDAKRKDVVEVWARAQVCHGNVDVVLMQHRFRRSWQTVRAVS
jgi:hypothetical protein